MNTKIKRMILEDKKAILPHERNALRLSIYFDFGLDNYHIQFPTNTTRYELSELLRKLSEAVFKGAKENTDKG